MNAIRFLIERNMEFSWNEMNVLNFFLSKYPADLMFKKGLKSNENLLMLMS